jgi:hypothetical protein
MIDQQERVAGSQTLAMPLLPPAPVALGLAETHLIHKNLWNTQETAVALVPEPLLEDPQFSHFYHKYLAFWWSHQGEVAKTPWSALRREDLKEQDYERWFDTGDPGRYPQLEEEVLGRGAVMTGLLVTANAVALPEGATSADTSSYLSTFGDALFGKDYTVADQDRDTHKEHMLTFAHNVGKFLGIHGSADAEGAMKENRRDDLGRFFGEWKQTTVDHIEESAEGRRDPDALLKIAMKLGEVTTQMAVVTVADVGFEGDQQLDGQEYSRLLIAAKHLGAIGGVEEGYQASGNSPVIGFKTALEEKFKDDPRRARRWAKDMRGTAQLNNYRVLQSSSWSPYARDSFKTLAAFVGLAYGFRNVWIPLKPKVWNPAMELAKHVTSNVNKARSWLRSFVPAAP